MGQQVTSYASIDVNLKQGVVCLEFTMALQRVSV